MNQKTKEIYSEVYSILNMLNNDYINKLPTSLVNMIKEEKLDSYNPKYESSVSLDKQNIKRETLSMIALLHLNYWCNSEEEKEELRKLFRYNEEKHQAELREKYNPDNIFKSEKNIEIREETQLIEVKKETFVNRIINNIKNWFRRNKSEKRT